MVTAWAQQPVFRCGQEYTNAPVDTSRCERLSQQAVTVIEGTRVQGREPAATVQAGMPPARTEVANQKQRDDMARTIVADELGKARQRHAQLQQEYLRAQTPQGSDRTAPPDTARVAQLKAAVDRAQRDIDSLQRELDKRQNTSP